MVKASKGPKFDISKAVEIVEDIGVPIFFGPVDGCGVFIFDPDDEFKFGHIEVSDSITPVQQFQTIIHEFVHFVDIVVDDGFDKSTIDKEVIAFGVEQIVFQKIPAHVAFKTAVSKVKKCYDVGFSQPTISVDDIVEMSDKIKDIFSI